MSILSDASLRDRLARPTEARIVVEPLGPDAIQPSSIDVRIGSRLRVYRHPVMQRVTTEEDWPDVLLNGSHTWTLRPGRCYLATTYESIKVPHDLVCLIHGRSSMARLFITPHQEAGLLDAGYQGKPTLEITVVLPVELAPFDPIAQLVFQALDRPALRPYGHPARRSRYQNQTEPEPAKEVP
jgi:dCTP deaminase